MKKELEDIARQINKIVNQKIRNRKLDINHQLDNMISNVKNIKDHLIDDLEIRFSDYLN